MFCDLVGSTPLAESLDPEDVLDVVRSYQTMSASVVDHYDGHVAQYLGDGILVFFGYPDIHEDDPVRAANAALDIMQGLGALNERIREAHDREISVRIGINTGLIVLDPGVDGASEASALGHTMNVASRIKDIAKPGRIVVSAETNRLLRGQFVTVSEGVHELKGISEPMSIFRVVEPTGVEDRILRPPPRGLTRYVGRSGEIEGLVETHARASSGRAQITLLRGESGIGKSRLAKVAREQIAEPKIDWLETRCSAYHEHSAHHPIINLLQRGLELERSEESASEKIRKVEAALEQAGLELDDYLPVLATFLSLPVPESYSLPSLTPEAQLARTREALIAWLFALASAGPIGLLVEDVHWIDPSTRSLIGELIERTGERPLWVLLTARPSFEPGPGWVERENFELVDLKPLGRIEVESMIRDLAGGKDLPMEAVDALIDKADGVPLFVEELTQSVLESGLLVESDMGYVLSGEPLTMAIPSTLRDSLMARLDRLQEARDVAQIAAVIGRDFSYDLLAAVSPLQEAQLESAVERLEGAGILTRAGESASVHYSFRHALIRDAAYESILKSTRIVLHDRIATTLRDRFPDVEDTQPELLARHFEGAGLLDEAVEYLERCGTRGLARGAYEEAIVHLERGLRLAAGLVPSAERSRTELNLLAMLGTVYFSILGYGNVLVRKTFSRARGICESLGEEIPLNVLNGLWSFNLVQCESDECLSLLPHFDRLSQETGDAPSLLASHAMPGVYAFYTGAFRDARIHLEEAITHYDTPDFQRFVRESGYDGGLYARAFHANVLWILGLPDRAIAARDVLREVAYAVEDPHARTISLMWTLTLAHNMREVDLAMQASSELLTLSGEQKMPVAMAAASAVRGWALSEQGSSDEAISQIQTGLSLYRMAGVTASYNYFLSYLARAYLEAGRLEDGLDTVDAALAACDLPLMRFNLADVLRIKGSLRHRQGNKDAEELVRQALDVAHGQGALSLELEAAVDLARLLQAEGRADEGHRILEGVFGRFEEGLETIPLRDAATLLGELA
jgi:class 3 adenylate cyclase/tetratricopeptide (TPR) repeat protein